jgi:hypothetical protein
MPTPFANRRNLPGLEHPAVCCPKGTWSFVKAVLEFILMSLRAEARHYGQDPGEYSERIFWPLQSHRVELKGKRGRMRHPEWPSPGKVSLSKEYVAPFSRATPTVHPIMAYQCHNTRGTDSCAHTERRAARRRIDNVRGAGICGSGSESVKSKRHPEDACSRGSSRDPARQEYLEPQDTDQTLPSALANLV